jgi:hypothetical protein
MQKFMMACAVASTLSACGGGGGGDSSGAVTPPTTTTTATVVTAEGLYVGSSSSGRTTTGLVLDDGTYYVIYSVQNNSSVIAGAVVGTGTSSNGSFSSTSAKDINLEGLGLLSGSLSASYTQQKSLNGSISYPSNQTVTFTGAYDSAFQTTPTLTAVAGTYTGRVGHPRGNEAASVTVSSSGAMSGRGSSGCVVNGSLTPRAKGNVYTTTVTFGGSPCLLPNTTLTGASYFDAATKRLYAVGMTSARDNGIIFAGAKP